MSHENNKKKGTSKRNFVYYEMLIIGMKDVKLQLLNK